MNRSFLILLLVSVSSPLAAQQTEYRFYIDPQQSFLGYSVYNWGGYYSVATEGTLQVGLDAPIAPTAAKIVDGLFRPENSPTLSFNEPWYPGAPWSPGVVSYGDLSFAMESPRFAINGSAFNAMPSAFVVSGNASFSAPGSGITRWSIDGWACNLGPTAGTITQSGSTLELTLDLHMSFDGVQCQGTLYAYADLADADPMALAVPRPLSLGQPNVVEIRNAPPGQQVYLCAGLSAFSSTPIAPLGVVIDLPLDGHSRLVAAPVVADANGNATVTATAPGWLPVGAFFLQAMTAGEVSNVSGTWVP